MGHTARLVGFPPQCDCIHRFTMFVVGKENPYVFMIKTLSAWTVKIKEPSNSTDVSETMVCKVTLIREEIIN